MDNSKQNTYCTRYTDSDVFAFSDVHGDFLALITYLQDCAGVIKLSDGVTYSQMLKNVKYNYQITNIDDSKLKNSSNSDVGSNNRSRIIRSKIIRSKIIRSKDDN
jgi:hypothetical protein